MSECEGGISDKFENLNDPQLKIYKSSIFLPFGRFNSSEKSPEHASEVYVGHEKQRTSFIRHILHSGKNCAYLITGQRGAGKTNFVNHCLREYDNSLAARYRNYKVERSTADVFFTSVFFSFIACVPGWMSQLLPLNYTSFYAWLFLFLTVIFTSSLIKQTVKTSKLFDNIMNCDELFIKGNFIAEVFSVYRKRIIFVFLESFTLCFCLTLISLLLFSHGVDIDGLLWFLSEPDYRQEFIIRGISLLPLAIIGMVLCFNFKLYNSLKFEKIKYVDPQKINSYKVYLISSNFYYIFLNLLMYNDGFDELYNSIVFISYYAIISSCVFFLVKLERKFIVYISEELEKVESDEDFEYFKKTLSENDGVYEGYTFKQCKTYYSLLSRKTWVYWYFNLWSPHIKVNVNLGFDDISHKNIVFTLLTEIRHKYYNHFVSWRSMTGFFQRAFLLSLIFVFYISFRILNPEVFRSLGDYIGLNEPVQAGLLLSFSFAILYVLTTYVIPVLPYKANVKRMDFILDRMTSVLTDENTLSQKGLSFKKSKIFQPLSSRDIEYQFLNIINMIRDNRYSFFGQFIQIPKPEITIIFDEMDKIGGEGDVNDNKKDSLFDETLNLSHTVRSTKIRELLSDLKNTINSKHCRFIFIGGRHLRDEWLAEQTKRDQLLPSIFDKEIYLSSFLTDKKEYEPVVLKNYLLYRTEDFLERKYQQAMALSERDNNHREWLHSKTNRYYNFPVEDMCLDITTKEFYLYPGLFIKTRDGSSELIQKCLFKFSDENTFFQQFVVYLAYRSLGLPKRLEELLSGFIEYKSKTLLGMNKADPVGGYQKWEDLLFFTDIDVIRIQFVNKVYRLIDDHLGRMIYNRDDKIATSLFYISDFIFKFHNRAFHRTSLERLDEIIDVHQSSDLRSMLDQLVAAFNGEILRPILNGMFEYRFTSTIASEIKYLSRFSPSEAAAFNFTLDESHSLKEMHLRKIKSERGSLEDLIGLAELYEYDREYDNAVNQYQCAIELLDRKLKVAGINENGHAEHTYLEVLSTIEREPEFFDITISFIIDWAVSRLRLMLRIGLVFEQRKDFERAGTNYHEAHIFSRRLLKVCLNEKVALKIPDVENSGRDTNDTMCPSTFYLAKHLTILYQAVFAKAWVAEKELTGIDTSLLIVNTELFYVEKLLPFKLSAPIESYKHEVAKGKILHPTFGLLKSEMYKKSGDLCFYKGATLPDLGINFRDNHELQKCSENPLKKQGFLYRASYFYSASLHYLRHFNIFMIQSSKKKYGLNHPVEDWENGVFSTDQLSEYPLTESASSILEYAETLVARVDLEELSSALVRPDHFVTDHDGTKKYKYDLSPQRLFGYTIQAHTAMDTWLKGKLNIKEEVESASSDFFGKLEKVVETNQKEIEKKQDSFFFEAEKGYLNKLKDIDYHENQFSLLNECDGSEDDKEGDEVCGKVNSVKDFVSMWLGNAKVVEPKSPHDTIMYSDIFSPSAIEKLVLYTVLVNQAARWQLRSGQKHDASHEYRRGMTTIVTALENIMLVITQTEKGGVYNPDEKIPLIADAESLFSLLITKALYFYERSLRFSGGGISKSEHKEKKLEADNIHGKLIVQVLRLNTIVHKIEKYFCKVEFEKKSTKNGHKFIIKSRSDINLAPRLFCYFGDDVLAGNPARQACDIKVHSFANALRLLVERYTSRDLKKCFDKPLNHKYICTQVALATPDILFRYSLVHRSTVQARIIALQHMLFCLATEPFAAEQDKTNLIFNRAEELLELMEQFDVNSDFLFAKTAIGCFLGARYISNSSNDADKEKQRYLLQRAKELFNKNHELYTMRAAYYQRVSNMYYLFDDFNDRTTHHGKALQIMSSVLTWYCEEECRKGLSKSLPINI